MANPTSKKREISIIERRLKSGSIFAVSAGSIPLKQPKRWELRIVNSEVRNGRIREMQTDKGWEFVAVSDLAVEPFEIGFREQDGRLVRGQHGQEVLMKMEAADYREVQLLKDAENRKNTFGQKATKQAILNAAQGESGGGRGAELLDRAIQGMRVEDSQERVSLED